MFNRLGDFISRFWWLIILLWIGLAVLTKVYAPKWDEVTNDGDLAYMPDDMTSVVAERVLERSFPNGRSKSEMAVILSRENEPLAPADLLVVDRVAARLLNLMGASAYLRAEKLFAQAAEDRVASRDESAEKTFLEAQQRQKSAVDAWNEALEIDPKLALTWNNLSLYFKSRGDDEEAQKYRTLALDYAPDIEHKIRPARAGEFPIWDVWTYRTNTFGDKLKSKDKMAQLLVVHLSQEFMATENVPILEEIDAIIDEVKGTEGYPTGLMIGLSGSAAVGADMLKSSAESISKTEFYTVVLVVVILIAVYRSPLLIVVPLTTIIFSLIVAEGAVAALTQLNLIPGFDWWNFKIFTTTKIFVVVILFGAGTDFCLFLISRFKEELKPDGSNGHEAVATAVGGVGGALLGSAFTTIVGLSMMFFADFGKFRNSGPAIGLCLTVTLIACLTLAPALLRALGKSIFWPMKLQPSSSKDANQTEHESTLLGRFWNNAARIIVAYPGRILVLSTLAMLPFAYMGTGVQVTYNFLSELDPDRPSKTGMNAMQKHFHIGETGPLVVLAQTQQKDIDSADGKNALLNLTRELYVEGVSAVRSLAAPEGEEPHDRASVRDTVIKAHELVRSLYLSKRPELGGDVARLEVILNDEPFSIDAMETLNRVESKLNSVSNIDPFWSGTEFVYSGTTAAIRDLRQVTTSDNFRIQVLVVLGVFTVLLFLLRRPAVCCFLILSVLFSYYATLGATEWIFKVAYGETFEGLDWKVPLFLFVILVAIGQDYNIYLVTRVFEEQEEHGLFSGLRRAIVKTGGIITSCGVIMAGTFVSMTTGSLRGIVELGFALSLGVVLDTFVVRPILVPSFLALLFRLVAAKSNMGSWFKARRAMTAASIE